MAKTYRPGQAAEDDSLGKALHELRAVLDQRADLFEALARRLGKNVADTAPGTLAPEQGVFRPSRRRRGQRITEAADGDSFGLHDKAHTWRDRKGGSIYEGLLKESPRRRRDDDAHDDEKLPPDSGFDHAAIDGTQPAARQEQHDDMYRGADKFPDCGEGRKMWPRRGGRLDGARLDNRPRKSAGRLDGQPLGSNRKRSPRLL